MPAAEDTACRACVHVCVNDGGGGIGCEGWRRTVASSMRGMVLTMPSILMILVVMVVVTEMLVVLMMMMMVMMTLATATGKPE